MKLIDSNVELIDKIDSKNILLKLEKACRTCYKSEDKISDGSAEKLIKSCIARGHESPLEHVSISFKIICDRGVSHELVRHRIASFSQESTRYCNYGKDKFNNELTFIKPFWWTDYSNTLYNNLSEKDIINLKFQIDYEKVLQRIENVYNQYSKENIMPDALRGILPNTLKTEVFMTMNLRELRHFLKLRTSAKAHPDIRKIAYKIKDILYENGLSILFDDIVWEK